jgi:hypothetical protein
MRSVTWHPLHGCCDLPFSGDRRARPEEVGDNMHLLRLFLLFTAVTLSGMSVSAGAAAQDLKHIGTKGQWLAYEFVENGGKVCYLASAPTRAEGKYSKRGDIYILVTHRQSAKTREVVSVVAGYTYATDSDVNVSIGKQRFAMFTEKDRAWTADSKVDQKMVSAMKRGMSMVVRGRSKRGTKTKDTYSLKGFTAGMKIIDKACAS